MKILKSSALWTMFWVGLTASPCWAHRPWNADISGPVGQAEAALALYERAGGMQARYPRPFQTLLEHAASYDQKYRLSTQQTSMAFERWEFEYLPSATTLSFNERKAAQMKEKLKHIVNEAILVDQQIVTQPTLEGFINDFPEYQYLFERFFFLWPFTKVEDGYRVFQRKRLLEAIDRSTAGDLERLYVGYWRNDLLPKMKSLVKGHPVESWVAGVKKNFYDAWVAPVFTLNPTKLQKPTVQKMTLELTPPIIALARNLWGEDRSAWSTMLYSLAENAKVYSVYLSEKKNVPDGYVFVAESKVGNRTLPYVLTINGNGRISYDTSRVILEALTRVLGTPDFLVPDFSNDIPHLMNSDSVARAMTFNNSELVQVMPDESWIRISQFAKETGAHKEFPDIYADARIWKARLVSIDQITEFGDFDMVQSGHASDSFMKPDAEGVKDLMQKRVEIGYYGYMFGDVDNTDWDALNFARASSPEAMMTAVKLGLRPPARVLPPEKQIVAVWEYARSRWPNPADCRGDLSEL